MIVVGMRTNGENSQVKVFINDVLVFRCFPEIGTGKIFTTNHFELCNVDTLKLTPHYDSTIYTADCYEY